jgi:MFS family permease
VRLGLRANWPQFSLLVVVNAFVGGMVGLERATTSLTGTRVFHLTGYLAVFSFIVAFGVTKALTNLAVGPLAARYARKTLLVAGWAAGLPVPFLLAYGPAWGWIVAANVLLGVNQGLAWSMTVNMKIDLVGPRGRGLAMGFNEAAGYIAVGATALATGYLVRWVARIGRLAQSSPKPAGTASPCAERARRAWSPTSTTVLPGAPSRCCLPRTASGSPRSG